MAFIEYRTKGGGGSDPTPIEPYEGKRGLTVSQWLSNSGSNAFGQAMETWLGLSWENAIKRWFNKKAPFDTLYTDIDQLCSDIMAWYYVRQPDWNKMKIALDKQYNPLENYVLYKTGTVDEKTGTVGDVGNKGVDSSLTSENMVAPYDSSTYHADTKEEASYDSDEDTSNTRTYNTKDTQNVYNHGNISMLITPQKLIEDEVELRWKYGLLNKIIGEFIREFCVALYN